MEQPPEDFLTRVADLGETGRGIAWAMVDAMLAGRYDDALVIGNSAWRLGIDQREWALLMQIINECFLFKRELEWTSHGFRRSFRFWSPREKQQYLRFAGEVIGCIQQLTPNVCLGYGAALAVGRSNDLIPHDDDLDLIIALPSRTFGTIAAAIEALEWCIEAAGHSIVGDYVSHRHVLDPTGGALDIFVGIEEDGYFSSYPGPRKAIAMSAIFPPVQRGLYGSLLPVPRVLDEYLSRVYGAGWRVPDPTFSHNWDRVPFADILGIGTPIT